MAAVNEQLLLQALDHFSKAIALFAVAGAPPAERAGGQRGCFSEQSACEYLDMGRTKFWQLVSEGRIKQPFQEREGGQNKWLLKDLDDYLKAVSKRRG